MTPEQLDAIEARAEAAKSVTGDDQLESRLAWCEDWEKSAYAVVAWLGEAPYDYALCIAEESTELLIHGPDDIAALVAEVRRLRAKEVATA